jgi:UDP-galactopyranose mutase
MQPYVQDNLRLECPVVAIDSVKQEVQTADGNREPYDVLFSTLPLDQLVCSMNGEVPNDIRSHASRLRHSGSLIVGVGIEQKLSSSKCWMYFPEDDCPFYRCTYLSNYSPEVVPDASRQYSILAEVSCSEHKQEDAECIVDQVIQGLINTRMLKPSDRKDIVDTHVIEREYTYPIPSLERDAALEALHPFLESRNIYSRGRFGAWRYEVGNMDHSVAQGVEWVNRMVRGDVKNELTYQAKIGC